ncbi:MAG TPA: hypothetical protein VEK08_17975, partial [Planctomycetota bacterium]|nr:hypothetical protein [Planctomycetota bacterium]
MKKFGWILALLFVPLVALAQDTEEIISLSNSGVSTDVMIAFVENSESSFQLTAEDIRRLREAKVPDAVIVKMLRHRGAGENTIITRNGVVAREPQRIVTRERVVEVPERTVVYTSPTYVSPVVYAGYYSYPRYYSSYCAPRYYPPYCPPR